MYWLLLCFIVLLGVIRGALVHDGAILENYFWCADMKCCYIYIDKRKSIFISQIRYYGWVNVFGVLAWA